MPQPLLARIARGQPMPVADFSFVSSRVRVIEQEANRASGACQWPYQELSLKRDSHWLIAAVKTVNARRLVRLRGHCNGPGRIRNQYITNVGAASRASPPPFRLFDFSSQLPPLFGVLAFWRFDFSAFSPNPRPANNFRALRPQVSSLQSPASSLKPFSPLTFRNDVLY